MDLDLDKEQMQQPDQEEVEAYMEEKHRAPIEELEVVQDMWEH